MEYQKVELEGYETLYIKPMTYRDNNRFAIQLMTLDNEPFATLTHNMSEINLKPNEIIVKTYSENKILVPLANSKFFKDTKRRINLAYVSLEIWTIENEELLNSLIEKQKERQEM